MGAWGVIIVLTKLDKAPRLSISIVIWVFSSDTIFQLNQLNTNSEVAMLSIQKIRLFHITLKLILVERLNSFMTSGGKAFDHKELVHTFAQSRCLDVDQILFCTSFANFVLVQWEFQTYWFELGLTFNSGPWAWKGKSYENTPLSNCMSCLMPVPVN